jgi:hypothetical protein
MENIMYQLLPAPIIGESNCIKRVSDNTYIPMDESNTDYQDYLKWVAEGNTPLPADEPTQGA